MLSVVARLALALMASAALLGPVSAPPVEASPQAQHRPAPDFRPVPVAGASATLRSNPSANGRQACPAPQPGPVYGFSGAACAYGLLSAPSGAGIFFGTAACSMLLYEVAYRAQRCR
jgi:hypothetical protein